MKRVLLVLLTAVLLIGCAGKSQKSDPIILVSEHNGETVAIVDETITSYLALPAADALVYLKENSYKKTSTAHDGQTTVLAWEGGAAPYVVSVGKDPAFSDAFLIEASRTKALTGTLLPETTYYWQVRDAEGNTSEIGTFVTGNGPRIIAARKSLTADGVRNVRDEGGWKTLDGRTVRYEMLYRGGLFEFPNNVSVYSKNVIDAYGLAVMNRLGIRTELDLRNETDCGGQTESPLDGCAYVRLNFTGYTSILPAEAYADSLYFEEGAPERIGDIFRLLAREESYPVYFHCLIGQDRTGTLSFLILGLLGVGYEDLVRDYELTAFSPVGNMNRETEFVFTTGEEVLHQPAAFTALHDGMLSAYGTGSGLLSDAIANYLVAACGVTEAEIESIRSILLEP